MNGYKILHVGDTSTEMSDYESFKWLAEKDIDIAFLPYMFFGDEKGKNIIDTVIRPKHLIPMHIHPSLLEGIAAGIKSAHPEAVIFMKELESRKFFDD
jgi:L-ascorbate metabolism protein UlaG (beta-lactamase superfamily)